MTNPFTFYGLTQKFNIDLELVKTKYYQIAKDNHPDFFMNDSRAYQKALEMTATNNESYKILTDFIRCTAFILTEKEMLKDSSSKLPIDFLTEIMDINESIDELKTYPDAQKLMTTNKQLSELESQIMDVWQKAAEACDQNILFDQNLQVVKDCYLKHKYFLRIKEALTTFATP